MALYGLTLLKMKDAENYMTNYKDLNAQLKAVVEDVDFYISNLSNASALLYECMDQLNWAGFYLMDDGELKLGPFQGKVACTNIKTGRGVCGTAVKEDATMLVANVHEFPGHIACDGASNSEIVIPIHKDGAIFGVLDIDSPILNRFSLEDKAGLEEFVSIIEKYAI